MKFSNYNINNNISCNNYYYINSIYEKKKSVTFKVTDHSINEILNKMFDKLGNDLIDQKLTQKDYYNILNTLMWDYINKNIKINSFKKDIKIDIIYKNNNFETLINLYLELENDIYIISFSTKKEKPLPHTLFSYTKEINSLFNDLLIYKKIKPAKKYYDIFISSYYNKFIYENSKYFNRYKNNHYLSLNLSNDLSLEYNFSLIDVTEVINETYPYFLNKIEDLISKTNNKEITLDSKCTKYNCKYNKICNLQLDNRNIEIINKDNLKKIFDSFTYPMYYLDFESFQSPYPRFKGEVPYTQHVFQYSLIKRENDSSKLEYFDYLAENNKDDFRLDLFTSLVNNIDLTKGGTILAYNSIFEETRLTEASNIFPSLKDSLLNIKNHIVDLEQVLKGDSEINYYNSKQNNSYSIKKVIPIFSKETYNELDIKNGTNAELIYANFDKFSKEELEKERKNLITYCRKDTTSMYEIEMGLKEKIGYKKL